MRSFSPCPTRCRSRSGWISSTISAERSRGSWHADFHDRLRVPAMTGETAGAVTAVARPAIQLPPAPGFDAERLRAQWVAGDPFPCDDAAIAYYAVKAAIAHWLQPNAVLEIGVRAGY